MRVIAGQAGGMRLKAPGGTTTRPTSDRVKEALFSILESADRLQDATVLDLFAGTGSLGIEALSRGAHHVVFVEKNRQAAESLQSNLAHTRLSTRATVIINDCMHSVEHLARRNEKYDLILLDPPYQAGMYLKMIDFAGSTILAPEGMLVAETAARESLPEQIGPCIRTDRRIYGDTAIEFYQMERTYAP